ncbi:hypothetical protein DIPPA_09062 [Diplonema papillatum]|nr:hypothetical protein DIPPA_31217 [Diplonema papillatum]KAJ9441280.1 hypothetical protein DIPPA_17345 [Diplonema papillatum]KAJ9441776.1 hypothetical protein DIPPA_09062 [Diplonema papillatum]
MLCTCWTQLLQRRMSLCLVVSELHCVSQEADNGLMLRVFSPVTCLKSEMLCTLRLLSETVTFFETLHRVLSTKETSSLMIVMTYSVQVRSGPSIGAAFSCKR